MVHDETCDYNPFDNIEYYNIHHNKDEVREQLVQHIKEVKDDEHKRHVLQSEDLWFNTIR